MKAHQTCVEILAMWLGKKPREEVARALSIPALRVWQLSQQALSGMLAGLLKQPRTRCRAEVSMIPSEDNPRVLKQKVAGLEAEIKKLEGLIQLVAQLPKPESVPLPGSTSSKPAAAKTRARRVAKKAEAARSESPAGEPAEAR